MSTPKELIFEEQARDYLRKGIQKLAEVVSCTLGPKGRNVGLEKSWGSPKITNDGGSIVNDITLENQYENMGVSMAKELVQKIKETCGDGTTSGIVLLNAIVEHGMKLVASGASPISVKRGMEKALEAILQKLDNQARKIQTNQEIRNIATAAASGDEEVGSTIAEAIEKTGKSGVVTIEAGKIRETVIQTVEGMQFDRGYISPYFCTNMEKMIVEMSQPAILLVDKKINNIHELLPILQDVASKGQELLIVAEDIEGDVLSTLVVNKLRRTLKVAAVKAPGFGDRRKAMLQDIAVLTGATIISEDAGLSLKEIPVDALGSAEKIVIGKDETVIVNGGGSAEAIHARVAQLENEIKECKNTYDKEKLEERKAKLSGGVAVIRVGAATQSELDRNKQVYSDSLNSTKAALESGVVAGGGIALLHAREAIKDLKLEGDEALGAKMLYTACEAPFKQIVWNSIGQPGAAAVMLSQILGTKKETYGFNARTGQVEDLFVSGVMDPAKVVRTSITGAVSVAGIAMITEALIADAPEDKSVSAT